MPKIGYGERKILPPQNAQELMQVLSTLIAGAVNNEVDLENAKVALNATTRLVEVWQADTRMKSIAARLGSQMENAAGWQLLAPPPEVIESNE